jgi:hypothetical protein
VETTSQCILHINIRGNRYTNPTYWINQVVNSQQVFAPKMGERWSYNWNYMTLHERCNSKRRRPFTNKAPFLPTIHSGLNICQKVQAWKKGLDFFRFFNSFIFLAIFVYYWTFCIPYNPHCTMMSKTNQHLNIQGVQQTFFVYFKCIHTPCAVHAPPP